MNWKFWRSISSPVIRAARPEPLSSDQTPNVPIPDKTGLSIEDYGKLQAIMEMVNPQSQPNINHLGEIVRNIRILSLNVKSLGYDLAKELAAALPPPGHTVARHVGLKTSLSTQVDLESDWAAHWCGQLKVPVLFHRKLWELSYMLQALHENGLLRAGARGIGFGSGSEPLSSYLASLGVASTVTDLPIEEAQGRGWIETNQHASGLNNAFHANLVAREDFDRLVDFRAVDMTAIPGDLVGYDFCWSICALEHLGSIANGLEFIERSLDTIKPGGIAIHTTEFNIEKDGPTVDNWPSVLFQQNHIEDMAARLRARGHEVAEIDLDSGDKVLDRFIDLPPWGHDGSSGLGSWLSQPHHLKVAVDGFIATCLGIVIRKAA